MEKKIDQKSYLQKYLSGSSEKKKKSKKSKRNGFKIIDDDVDYTKLRSLDEEELDLLNLGEDAPQIAGIIDERPEEIRKLEQFKISSKWRVVNQDDGFNSKIEVEEIKQTIKEKRKENEIVFGKMYSDSEEDENKDTCELSPRKKKSDSNSDISLPRNSKKACRGNRDQSPRIKVNKSNNSDSDTSSPRNTKSKSSKYFNSNKSPPRRKRNNSDSDPPTNKNTKGKKYFHNDQSPPRRKRNISDSDNSPPRNSKSNARKDFNTDQSPPRRKRNNSDSDNSPPRNSKSYVRKGVSTDQSPPRRKRNNSDSDISPPRNSKSRARRDFNTDQSPSRRKRNNSDSDISPPRNSKKKCGEDDQSPPRKKQTENSKLRKKSRWEDEPKTLDGKIAGLQNATQLRDENEAFRRREALAFTTMTDEISGRNANAVSRKSKRETSEDRRLQKEKAEKQKLLDEKYKIWNRGIKQMEAQEQRVQDYLHEASKPLARLRDDVDLEKALRDEERNGDPMLEYIRDKKREMGELPPERPTYKGNFPINRFNIRPGFRWDGVDRSNGYEKKYFESQSQRKAQEEEAYKWSSADL